MQTGSGCALRSHLSRATRLPRGMRRGEEGFTAVEFGIVAIPFLMLLFGIIEVGLLYFTTFSLENSTEQAARSIRTGQAKTASWTKDDFKTALCNKFASVSAAGNVANCKNKVRVDVRVFAEGTTPTIPSGLVSGNLIADADTSYTSSAGGDVVLVTAYYPWQIAKIVPFLKLGNMSDGRRLLQASVVFKNEPFN
jgi:Flp pilus assembly protein TadG